MKKISLFALVSLFSIAVFAQAETKFGLKAGVNIATINWSVDLDSRIGFHAGLLAHIHLAPQLALQPEVMYSTEGARQAVTNGEYVWKTDYVNIPLMLQYMFSNGFRIEAGPQLGLLVNTEDEDVFKSTNVGIGFGLNYLTYSGIGVGGRYILGVSKINEANWPEAKSRNFQISLFYMLNPAHKVSSR